MTLICSECELSRATCEQHHISTCPQTLGDHQFEPIEEEDYDTCHTCGQPDMACVCQDFNENGDEI